MRVQTSLGVATIKIMFSPADRRKNTPAFWYGAAANRVDIGKERPIKLRSSRAPYRRTTTVELSLEKETGEPIMNLVFESKCSEKDNFRKAIGRYVCLQKILRHYGPWTRDDRRALYKAICPVVPGDYAEYCRYIEFRKSIEAEEKQLNGDILFAMKQLSESTRIKIVRACAQLEVPETIEAEVEADAHN